MALAGFTCSGRSLCLCCCRFSPSSCLLRLIDAARIFDKIFVMTRGGPGSSAYTATLTIYIEGFNKYDFGYASALSFLFQIVLVIIATIYVKRVMVDYSAPRES